MRAPRNVTGDRLIRDYLARVTRAGLRYLPKGNRAAFVQGIKAQIEAGCGLDGISDPARVQDVLSALGEPEDLVRAERARIDAEWVRKKTSRRAGEATGAVPAELRPFTSRWRPASHAPPAATTQPLPVIPAGDRGALMPGPGPGGGEAANQEPLLLPDHAWAAVRNAARLARRHALETTAIIVIGAGGLIFPILPPIWVLGGLLALASRLWTVPAKAVAFFGPLLFAVLISMVIGGVAGDRENFVLSSGYTFLADAGYLIRAGCVVCAIFLAWQMRRGPRMKLPPWQRDAARPGR